MNGNNIMNGYFINIATTIVEPVDEEAQLLTDHKFYEWANEKHNTNQSIIVINSVCTKSSVCSHTWFHPQ